MLRFTDGPMHLHSHVHDSLERYVIPELSRVVRDEVRRPELYDSETEAYCLRFMLSYGGER